MRVQDWMFGVSGLVALSACVAFIATGSHALIFGGILGVACTTFWLLEANNNKSKNK